MRLFWFKEAFVATRWDRGGARLIGLKRGLETLLWPVLLIFLVLFQAFWLVLPVIAYAPWLMAVLPGALLLALGHHFDITIGSDGVLVRTRIWGIVIEEDVFDADEVVFEFLQGLRSGYGDEDSQDRAVIRSKDHARVIELGDNFSARTLHRLFDEAWSRMKNDPEAMIIKETIFDHVPAPTETTPIDIREVAAQALAHARSEPLVFVSGWSVEATRRVGIYVRYMDQLELVFDGYVDSGQIEGLRERIAQDAHVLDGDWDEMALTSRRRYVWSTSPFVLYRRGRRYLRVASQSILLRSRMIHKHEIERVLSVFTGARTGVDLELKTGERVKVARHVCLGAIFDPLYDSWELEFDTIWCESLARSLAEAIDVGRTRDGY